MSQHNLPPHNFICPLTKQLMTDPVLAADGITYERAEIERWMQTSNVSPVTGKALSHKELTPNSRLKAAIISFQLQKGPSPPPFLSRAHAVPAETLPSGWQPMSSGGHPVYVNPASGEISHEKPVDIALLAPSAPPAFLSRQGNAGANVISLRQVFT
jgi:hypothetical protein